MPAHYLRYLDDLIAKIVKHSRFGRNYGPRISAPWMELPVKSDGVAQEIGSPASLIKRTRAILSVLEAEFLLDDLRFPSGNHLDELKGDRAGDYWVRLHHPFNRQSDKIWYSDSQTIGRSTWPLTGLNRSQKRPPERRPFKSFTTDR